MSAFFRRRIEATIEHMIAELDEMDGDPDDEPEAIEEQGDMELDDRLNTVPLRFVIAKAAQRPN